MGTKKYISMLMLFLCCCCTQFSDPPSLYKYIAPEEKGLPSGSLDDAGLAVEPIVAMTNKIIREEYKRIDAVLIVRDDKLVYEQYFHGYTADVPHNIFSSTKSIISILTGIAIDKGYLSGVSATVLPMLPAYNQVANWDPRKNDITIAHLLNMSAGLACDDWFGGTEDARNRSSDPIRFVLDLPLIHDPGTVGQYCTGGVSVLSRVIENQSGMSIDTFADKFLFKPMGIHNYRWIDGKLFLTPQDMAKIGLLMLHDGNWQGEQLVSATWCATSKEIALRLPGPFDGYGYLWWKQAFGDSVTSYFSSGNGGQDIFIFPEKNMVVVFTTGNKNTALGLQNIYILRDHILPALQ